MVKAIRGVREYSFDDETGACVKGALFRNGKRETCGLTLTDKELRIEKRIRLEGWPGTFYSESGEFAVDCGMSKFSPFLLKDLTKSRLKDGYQFNNMVEYLKGILPQLRQPLTCLYPRMSQKQITDLTYDDLLTWLYLGKGANWPVASVLIPPGLKRTAIDTLVFRDADAILDNNQIIKPLPDMRMPDETFQDFAAEFLRSEHSPLFGYIYRSFRKNPGNFMFLRANARANVLFCASNVPKTDHSTSPFYPGALPRFLRLLGTDLIAQEGRYLSDEALNYIKYNKPVDELRIYDKMMECFLDTRQQIQTYAFEFRNHLKRNLQYPITSYELTQGHNTVMLQRSFELEADIIVNKMHKWFILQRPYLNHFFDNFVQPSTA